MRAAPKLATLLAGEDLSDRTNGSGESAMLFGPFRLLPTQRLLLEGDKSVELGSRALDILITLVERPGDLVSKEELMARVWSKIFVGPANLTVHVARLRRALGDGHAGKRYIINIPGRGYRFVAPVTFEKDHQTSNSRPTAVDRSQSLPPLLTRPIGRAQLVRTLAAQVPQRRLVALVGPGGIGKTTVGVTAAHGLTSSFAHGSHFIGLAPLSDPSLVPCALASVLGIEVGSSNLIPELVAFLRDKHVLLVFDGCELVIDGAATLAAAVLEAAPKVHILATSREPLHVAGEHLYRLPPLETPLQVPNGMTAADAMISPAVRLFVERTAASLGGFELSDADAPIVAEICSKLDGIPLAIESAAADVAALGLRGLALHLNDPLQCLMTDKSVPASRHLSLRAALDRSYDRLSEYERVMLRRLSIFVGDFASRAASDAAGSERTFSEAVACLTSLVRKSLVSADVSGRVVRYRLLHTTRAYLLEKLKESGEFDEIAFRHAEFLRTSCKQTEVSLENPADLASYARLQRDRKPTAEAQDLPMSLGKTAARAKKFA
jgi:predicted ATPase/DNA-binding winged helix-turn-helix (wHTH) protein